MAVKLDESAPERIFDRGEEQGTAGDFRRAGVVDVADDGKAQWGGVAHDCFGAKEEENGNHGWTQMNTAAPERDFFSSGSGCGFNRFLLKLVK